MQVNFCVILYASIYLTVQDQPETNFSVVSLKEGEEWHVHSKTDHRNTETLLPQRINPREYDQHHIKKESEKTFEACERENSSSCTKYIVTSVHVWKNHRKRQSKPCMHLVTPRGTQCDTLYIIASIFSLIFATEWREKVSFVLKWPFFHALMQCKEFCHWSEETTFRIV